jgi:hypothetical protein
LRSRVWAYQPDVVVLAFLTGNDVRNNSRELERDPLKPYFVLRDGRLVLDDSFQRSPQWVTMQQPAWLVRRWLLQHTHLAQVVFETYQSWRARIDTVPAASAQPVAAQADDDGMDGQEAGLDDRVYQPPTTDAWVDAWAVTEALIRAMHDDVQARGARFLLATLSNGIQVHPDPAARQRFQDRLGLTTLFYPDMRLRAFAAAQGIPHVTLAPALQRVAEASQQSLHGFGKARARSAGHWNEDGHHAAGQILTTAVCDLAAGGASDAAP